MTLGSQILESFFKGFRGQEVGPILPHFCNAWMARGEAPSEKHSIRNSFEIIPTAPMGPKGAEGALGSLCPPWVPLVPFGAPLRPH